MDTGEGVQDEAWNLESMCAMGFIKGRDEQFLRASNRCFLKLQQSTSQVGKTKGLYRISRKR